MKEKFARYVHLQVYDGAEIEILSVRIRPCPLAPHTVLGLQFNQSEQFEVQRYIIMQ